MKTTLRQEFHEMKGSATESVPKQGEFFKHQDLFMRYVRQYDRILNIHETGTGKTGSIVNTSESFREKFSGIKQVVIIEPGAPTLEDFRSQIVKFFPEKYDDPTATNEFSRKRNIKKKISKWYVLDTYEAFSNKLAKMSQIDIEDTFSDTMFFLDEAHRMRNYGEEGEDENIYINIWKLLHIAKRTKIVIGTATPLVNSVNDFVPIANLLLSEKAQLPLTGWDYSKITLTQLEPFLRGKVSFVRSLDSGVKINYNGVKINYTQKYKVPQNTDVIIPPVEKEINEDGNIVEKNQPVQERVLLEDKEFKSDVNMTMLEMKKNGEKTIQYLNYKIARRQKQSFELASRESSTFVFPDGSWGIKGFNKYIQEKDKQFKFKNDDVKKFIKDNGVLSLSSKFNFYIKKELESSENNRPGSSFCYLEFVKGSGVILLGLILEIFGFKNYTKLSSSFIRSNGQKKINPTFKPAKRFALITSKTENLESILELFNSPENIDGKYLQIVVASKIARDGINLANVKRGYIMSPGWHESGMYQALSRFIRATSHKLLLDRDTNVEIDIYKLASCLEENFDDDITNIKENSIDVFNYMKSEEKDLYNRIILRDMKNLAFDAILNYNRNHRSTDVDFSKQTDYGPKFPDVWSNYDEENERYFKEDGHSIDERYIKKNTKKLLYYQKEIEKLDRLVRTNITNFNSITVNQLLEYSRLNKIDEYYVFLYISKYITKLNVEDRFGNKRKIIKDGNIFILDRLNHHFTATGFIKLPMVENIEIRQLSEFYNNVKDLNKVKLEEYIRDMIWKLDSKNKTIVSEITPAQQYMRDILEDCIISKRNNTTNELKMTIYQLFDKYINKADYPKIDVEKVKEAYDTNESKAGRVAKKFSKTKLSKLVFEKKDTGVDTTYYHFFNVVTETNVVANIFKREDNMVRILKPGSNTFMDANINELPIFQKYYTDDITKFIKYYEREIEHGILSYGTIFRDNKFRIINPPFGKSRGIVCGSNKEISYDILSKINLSQENVIMIQQIMPEEIQFLNKTLNMDLKEINDQLYPEEMDNVNSARQKFFWKTMLNRSSKKLCKYLENFFRYKNKLLNVL